MSQCPSDPVVLAFYNHIISNDDDEYWQKIWRELVDYQFTTSYKELLQITEEILRDIAAKVNPHHKFNSLHQRRFENAINLAKQKYNELNQGNQDSNKETQNRQNSSFSIDLHQPYYQYTTPTHTANIPLQTNDIQRLMPLLRNQASQMQILNNFRAQSGSTNSGQKKNTNNLPDSGGLTRSNDTEPTEKKKPKNKPKTEQEKTDRKVKLHKRLLKITYMLLLLSFLFTFIVYI